MKIKKNFNIEVFLDQVGIAYLDRSHMGCYSHTNPQS